MSAISAQDMERYRQCVASIDMPPERKDELINIVHSIMSHFVDQAFGIQTDQISIQSKNNSLFQSAFDYAMSGKDEDKKRSALPQGGAKIDSSLGEPDAP